MPQQPLPQRLEDISASMESLANELASYAQTLRNSHETPETQPQETYLVTLRYDALLQSLKSELSRTRAMLAKAQHDAERYKRLIDELQKVENVQAATKQRGSSGLIDQHSMMYRKRNASNIFL